MLSIFELSATIKLLNVVMLNIIILSVTIMPALLNENLLNVIAPLRRSNLSMLMLLHIVLPSNLGCLLLGAFLLNVIMVIVIILNVISADYCSTIQTG